MIRERTVEIWVGILVLLAALALLFLALRVSGLSTMALSNSGYQVTAAFDNIGDLKVRAPVTIGGVRVGEVVGIRLDPTTFRAIVTLRISSQDNAIPLDSSASIYTEGLLGSNYVSLTPGFSNENLKNGDKITDTHSALILENLIGQLMFKLGGGGSSHDNSNHHTSNQ